ncbi:CAP domain-containing protein [Nocardia sp. NPDC005825]|uniref:CAP domain-containing protein n=1 Tax=unclassified Nocardia TaxID=2637762 RepID=UPI003409FAE5
MNLRSATAALAIAAGATVLALPATAQAAPYTNCDVDTPSLALRGEEPDVFNAINNLRAANGLKPVTHTTVLSRPAEWASNDSANRGSSPSNHVDTLGRDIKTRFQQCGVPANTSRIAEINYWGYNVTPANAMNFWEHSPTHRAIILDKNLTRVGVSVIYKDNHQHWTVTFAS